MKELTIQILFSVLVACLLSLLVSCGQNQKQSDQSTETQLSVESHEKNLSLPVVPDSITDTNEKLNYLITHYWKNFNIQDTTLLSDPDYTEQAYVDYLSFLFRAEKSFALESLRNLLIFSEKEPTGTAFRYFIDQSRKYLFDPNSPFRNDEFYIPIVEYIIASKNPILNHADKERAKYNLKMMLKNRVGEKANDILYTRVDGTQSSLYKIESAYIILFFNDPDCTACKEATQLFKDSEVIGSLLETNQLQILAFYTGSDYNAWRKHQKNIPTSWISGYDKDGFVSANEDYDLKATPTLYLLNRSKKVLLKDVDDTQIIYWLQENALSPLIVN